jgi:adenylate cyclase
LTTATDPGTLPRWGILVAEETAMLGQLVPCGGGPPIPLLKPKLLVGRHAGCDIPLRFASVSGRHCELEFKDGYWLVRDLGSSNGTRVNGAPVESRWLMPDDVLALAQYRYRLVYTPPKDRPPPEGAAPVAKVQERPARGALPPLIGTRDEGEPEFGELIPCGGGDPIPLLKPRLILGRSESCDIVLRLATISARHCQLDWIDGYWYIRDLGSRNGIKVDGVRCQSERLAPESVLWISGLRFQVVYKARGAAAPPQKGRPFAQSLLEKAGLLQWEPPEPPAERGKAGRESDPGRERYSLDEEE